MSQNDATTGHCEDEGITSSEGIRNSADVATETSLDKLNIHEEKKPLVGTTSCNGHSIQNHETERDMERALKHQAQFIAQYEEEEKAQKEWEDKFRENNGSPPVSYLVSYSCTFCPSFLLVLLIIKCVNYYNNANINIVST